MEQQHSVQDNPLAFESTGRLIAKYSVPSVIAMLVSSLYNIVDQIFIGQGVGMLGNAATNVAFPFVNVCIALSLLIGIGGASNFNLNMGRGKNEKAKSFAGTSISLLILSGLALSIFSLLFLKPILIAFGSTKQVFPLCPDLHKDHCTGISVSDRHQWVLQSDSVRRQPQILYGRHSDRSRHQHLSGPSVYLWIPLGHRRRSRGHGHRPGRLLCHGRCLSHKIPDHEAHKRLSEDQGG